MRRAGASSMAFLGFRRPGVCSTVGGTAGGLRCWWETRVDGEVGLTQAPAQLETEAASDTSKRAGRVGRVGEFPGGLEACKEPLILFPCPALFLSLD